MTNQTQYDRFAKQLWVKVYQDELNRSNDHEEAKDSADLAVANYMNSIHGEKSDVKKNFTTDTNVQNMHKSEVIEVPFKLDYSDDIILDGKHYHLRRYCIANNINQTRIKRILLEMKSEDE